MIYGLIAAAGWGVSSVAAAQAARRMGTLAALLISQATGTVALLAVLALMRPLLVSLPSATMWGLAGAGFFSLVGWLTYYRALEHGPVGIVSGAAATYGGVTALLALLVLGEPLGRYVGLGDALAGGGGAGAGPARDLGRGDAGDRFGGHLWDRGVLARYLRRLGGVAGVRACGRHHRG